MNTRNQGGWIDTGMGCERMLSVVRVWRCLLGVAQPCALEFRNGLLRLADREHPHSIPLLVRLAPNHLRRPPPHERGAGGRDLPLLEGSRVCHAEDCASSPPLRLFECHHGALHGRLRSRGYRDDAWEMAGIVRHRGAGADTARTAESHRENPSERRRVLLAGCGGGKEGHFLQAQKGFVICHA